jgi:transglutaminase-like putative cysteine protease
VGAVFAAKVNAPVMIYDEEYVSQSIKTYLSTIGGNKVKYVIGNWDTEISTLNEDRSKAFRSNNGDSDYFQADIEGNTINIEGKTVSGNKWAILAIEKMDVKLENGQYSVNPQEVRDTAVPVDDEGNFRGSLELSGVSEGCTIDIYMSGVRYGTYSSVYLGIPLTLSGSNEVIFKSNDSVYDANRKFQEYIKGTDPSAGTRVVNDTKIKEFAMQLTEGIDSSWDKVKAIHDWIAGNIYYDLDVYNGKSEDEGVYDGESAFSSKLAVCQGYADLFQMMLNSVGIPCRMVYGKAVQYYESWDDADQSTLYHAWNEAYINGRWVIIDVTWDSGNKYEGGIMRREILTILILIRQ